MATKSIDLGAIAYQAAPFLWGQLQDVSGMNTVYGGQPFVVANDLPGMNFVMDTRGRMTNANLTNGQGVQYNLDDAGNRTSVVVS